MLSLELFYSVFCVFHVVELWKLFLRIVHAFVHKSSLLLKSLLIVVNMWLWPDAECSCLAGVGRSRERPIPEDLHLPFGSRAWCLLDPLWATPSHWLIWQCCCDNRRRDRWAATCLPADLINSMPLKYNNSLLQLNPSLSADLSSAWAAYRKHFSLSRLSVLWGKQNFVSVLLVTNLKVCIVICVEELEIALGPKTVIIYKLGVSVAKPLWLALCSRDPL